METVRKVVANLGFLLQITGLLLILPIMIGLYNGETQAATSIGATCFVSFGMGFIFNSFCERKELDENTSLWLMFIAFTILPLILSIPFIWNNVFNSSNLFDLFTNAYFETISGFTTTGFTFITNTASLPMSLFFYHSYVEFIGGIGFVYLIVAFLYPTHRLGNFAEAFGIDELSSNLKKVFLSILLIYTIFTVIFTAIFYVVYSSNIIVASTLAIDILTGGYAPKIAAEIGILQISILILMLLGSVHFGFHYNFFRFKFRDMLTPEIKLYLEIIFGAAILLAILAWINPFDSLFHVISMMSSTGADYINVAATPVAAKIIFILIGLVGGCTFSMAGGIRIQKIHFLIDSLRKKGKRTDREELKIVIISIASFFIALFILSLIFSTIGIPFIDAVFEVGSAITTNGISMGITTVTIPLMYKWLLIFAMAIGRIEILVVFRILKSTNIFNIAQRFMRSRVTKKSSFVAHKQKKKIKIKS